MQVSSNLKSAAKGMIGTGVPAWFAGVLLTDNLASNFNSDAFTTALATLLLFGGVMLISAGMLALIAGAAIADIKDFRLARANRPVPPA